MKYNGNLCVDVLSESPPTSFIRQPYSRSASIDSPGNRKVLHCQASGSPSPVYQWMKDGWPLSATNTSDIAFVIPRIRRSDAGNYQCVASNRHGSLLSVAAQVNVACESHLLSFLFITYVHTYLHAFVMHSRIK